MNSLKVAGKRADDEVSLKSKLKVPPRFELGSLDSKSSVLTVTPWDHSRYDASLLVMVKQAYWQGDATHRDRGATLEVGEGGGGADYIKINKFPTYLISDKLLYVRS